MGWKESAESVALATPTKGRPSKGKRRNSKEALSFAYAYFTLKKLPLAFFMRSLYTGGSEDSAYSHNYSRLNRHQFDFNSSLVVQSSLELFHHNFDPAGFHGCAVASGRIHFNPVRHLPAC